MSHAPRVLETQCEWTSDDFADESVWTETFAAHELEELDAALRHALARSQDVLEIRREDFPLPKLHHRLVEIERELIGAARPGVGQRARERVVSEHHVGHPRSLRPG